MKKTILTLSIGLLLFLSTSTIYGQPGKNNYEANFEWLKKTFEENDAGFQYIVDKKGSDAYELHNKLYLEKIRSAKSMSQSMEIMSGWLSFFRMGHIGVWAVNNNEDSDESQIEPEFVFKTVDVDIEAFKKEAEGFKNPGYEGVWKRKDYTIGIRKQTDGSYAGFVIETQEKGWKPGDLKLSIGANSKNTIFYLDDHAVHKASYVKMLGPNRFSLDGLLFDRISPVLPETLAMQQYMRSIQSGEAYIERLNDNTLMLRLPGFGIEQKQVIDSIIKANFKLITSTENLIIDLRNNGGGGDESYGAVTPILYTNPVRHFNIEMRSTPLNNQRWLKISKYPGYEDMGKRLYEKAQASLGGFFPLRDQDVTVQSRDNIYAYPRKVGIIINEGVASSAEQFLLEANQSMKVKLFGTHTQGALDVSNICEAVSPNGQIALTYCCSRSMRIPVFEIDDVGLQPDYFIDNSIPDYQWVDLVTKILNGF